MRVPARGRAVYGEAEGGAEVQLAGTSERAWGRRRVRANGRNRVGTGAVKSHGRNSGMDPGHRN